MALAERHGPGELRAAHASGAVAVDTAAEDGGTVATLTSVAPHVDAVADADVVEALDALGWAADDLDPALPPRVAYAGAAHLGPRRGRPRARWPSSTTTSTGSARCMAARDWTTVAARPPRGPATFHARNPFPPGGVVEDPATGAAAAAFGAYLRELGAVDPPARMTIHQGEDIGRRACCSSTSRPGSPTASA